VKIRSVGVKSFHAETDTQTDRWIHRHDKAIRVNNQLDTLS